MYKVYIENNVILFAEQEPTDPENEALRMHINLNDTFSITKLLQKLQFTKKLYLISDDSSALFEQFCSSLRFIEAGGGWVTDRSNRILMIFRNGKWDLPKGKREVGEAIETCAVREVSEECALAQQDLKCGELLTQTFHCYQMHGEWIVKRTSWFRMYYQGEATPTPQTVEGITKAEWVPRDQADELLLGTYGTIRDVFHAAVAREKNGAE